MSHKARAGSLADLSNGGGEGGGGGRHVSGHGGPRAGYPSAGGWPRGPAGH